MNIVKQYLKRFLKLSFGCTLISAYVVVTKQAQCLSPWYVLNDGVSNLTGISLGQASIAVGLLILIIDIVNKEHIGFGTIFDVFVIGAITDIFTAVNNYLGLMPRVEQLPLQLLWFLVALTMNVYGIYFIMSACMGAGPRDSLFVVLKKKLPIPVGVCKLFTEFLAVLTGFLMGGEVGWGTFLFVICGGPALQLVFTLHKFDVTKIYNETPFETINNIKNGLQKKI